jgi:hypothetical protein
LDSGKGTRCGLCTNLGRGFSRRANGVTWGQG